MAEKEKDKFDPNRRVAVAPSAANDAASNAIISGVGKLADTAKNVFNAFPATKIAKAGMEKIGQGYEAVMEDRQNTMNYAGKAADYQDESAAGGRTFKTATGMAGPQKAESINLMAPPAIGKKDGSNIPSVAEENMNGAGGAPEYTPDAIKSLTAAYGVDPGKNNNIGRITTPGSGMMRNEQTGETTTIDASGKMTTYDRSGNIIDKPTTSFAPAPQQQAQGQQPYDVKFAPGTSQQEIDAFNRAPTQPGTRMRSGINPPDENSVMNKYHQKFQSDLSYNPGESAHVPDAGSTGAIGWRERTANKDRAAQTSTADKNRTADIMKAGVMSQNNIDVANIGQQGAADRNAIDRMKAGADVNLTNSQAARNEQINSLSDQITKETDPAKRKLLQENLYSIQGGARGGSSEGNLTQAQWIKADNDLRAEYDKHFNSVESNPSKDDYVDGKPIDYNTWARKYRGGAADMLYGKAQQQEAPAAKAPDKAVVDGIMGSQWGERYKTAPDDVKRKMEEAYSAYKNNSK